MFLNLTCLFISGGSRDTEESKSNTQNGEGACTTLLFGPVGGRLYCSLVPTVLASFPNYPCKQWCLQKGHMIYGLASRNRLSLNILEIPHVKKSQLNDWATAAQAEALPCSIV